LEITHGATLDAADGCEEVDESTLWATGFDEKFKAFQQLIVYELLQDGA
jgi:hypothetical protein